MGADKTHFGLRRHKTCLDEVTVKPSAGSACAMTSGAFELGAPLPPELDTEHCPCWSFDQTELSPRTSWRELGEGSFGCVYLAHWLGTEVAVKMNASDKANRYEGIFRDVRYLRCALRLGLGLGLGLLRP